MAFCRKCGKEIEDTASFCDSCGAPTKGDINSNVQAQTISEKPPKAGICVAGFVVSLCSCFIDPIALVSITGIALSAVGLNKIKANPTLGGKGLAVAGLVIGIVECVLKVIQIMTLI